MKWDSMTWESAYDLLANPKGVAANDRICSAITRLGKPYDEQKIIRAAPLVAEYLKHEDFLVRYQAIWLLGCWGRLREYLSCIVQAAQSDADIDNRAFAARCAGRILESHPDANAAKILLRLTTAEQEAPDVRAAAYAALLLGFFGKRGRTQAHGFDPSMGKSVRDFDLAWLASLPKWIEGLAAKQRSSARP